MTKHFDINVHRIGEAAGIGQYLADVYGLKKATRLVRDKKTLAVRKQTVMQTDVSFTFARLDVTDIVAQIIRDDEQDGDDFDDIWFSTDEKDEWFPALSAVLDPIIDRLRTEGA